MLGSKGLPQSHESVSSNIFAGSLSRLKCFIRSGGCCIPSRAVAYSWLPLSTTRFWSWLSILWSLSWRNLLLLFCNSILRTLCEDLVYKGCSSHSERSPACKICISYLHRDHPFEPMTTTCTTHLHRNPSCILTLGPFRYTPCVTDDRRSLLKLRGTDPTRGTRKIRDTVRCAPIRRLKSEAVLSHF